MTNYPPEDRLPQVLARIPNEWGKTLRFAPGWDGIVEALDAKLALLDDEYVVHQAKEKFGVLEYYIDLDRGYPPEVANEMFRLTNEARDISSRTCEECGVTPAKTAGAPNWLATLCDPCRERAIARYEERRRAFRQQSN